MGVRAVGLAAVSSQLRAAADQIGDLTATNADVAAFVADKARAGMPRRSGALVASVRTRADDHAAVITVGTRYARPVLFGAPRAGTRPARVTPYGIALDYLPAYLQTYETAAADAAALVKG